MVPSYRSTVGKNHLSPLWVEPMGKCMRAGIWCVLCSWVYLGTQHDHSDRNWAVICLGFGGVGHSPILWMARNNCPCALKSFFDNMGYPCSLFSTLTLSELGAGFSGYWWSMEACMTSELWFFFYIFGLGTTAGYVQVLFLALCPHPS